MLLLIIMVGFIGIGAVLSWYLISRDHGEEEPVGALWIAAGLGFLGAIAAGITEGFLISDKSIEDTIDSPLLTLLKLALIIGVIEEFFKFIFLAVYIYRKSYFNEHTDGIIYFALAGLAFGIPENVLYSLQYGVKIGLIRLLFTPIFHAATTATVGYYLAKAKVEHKSLAMPAVALGAMMLVHGLYDFGLFSGTAIFTLMSAMLTLAMTTIFFVLFTRARETDEAAGLTKVGNNNFCRACGFPNPQHKLYCTHCGKHA